MARKSKAFEEKGAAMGHNKPSDDDLIKHVEKRARLLDKRDKIDEELKDDLNDAKDKGFLKTAIRKGCDKLRASAAVQQAKKEVELEAERIFELCRDLPLFASSHGGDPEEEAA